MALPERARTLSRGVTSRTVFKLREILLEGFAELAADSEHLEFLIARADELDGGSQTAWTSDLLRAVRTVVLRPQSPLQVLFAYPNRQTALPCLTLITAGGGEDNGNQTIGNEWVDIVQDLPPRPGAAADEPTRRRQLRMLSVPWQTRVQVATWAPQAELAQVLHDLAIDILQINQGRCGEAGIKDITISEREGFVPNWAEAPSCPVVPSFEVALRWDRYLLQRRNPVPTRVVSHSTTVSSDS